MLHTVYLASTFSCMESVFHTGVPVPIPVLLAPLILCGRFESLKSIEMGHKLSVSCPQRPLLGDDPALTHSLTRYPILCGFTLQLGSH